jgi:putative methyltransferase (TIGR04325 family)
MRYANSYVGVYKSFAEARAAIGAHTIGYDSTAGAALYRERLDVVQPEDYPLLFWMSKFALGLDRVFDFGGHIGLHYYAMAPKLDLPGRVIWLVSDVPAVIAEGRALARARSCDALRFETGMSGADGADLLLSSGALQYLEGLTLVRALRGFRKRPRYVLLNKLPVREAEGFVTVQDTWAMKNPYTIFSRAELTGGLEALGYRLRDEWTNPGVTCLIWRRPDLSVRSYSGFCFERESA